MKSLAKFISEMKTFHSMNEYIQENISSVLLKEEQFDKISTEWMIENYDKFNEMYFDSKLPFSIDIDIQYTTAEMSSGTLGCQGCHKSYWVNKSEEMYGGYGMLTEDGQDIYNILDLEPYIYINSSIPMSMNKYEDTLLHEMIHLWTRKDCIEPKQVHGKEFRAKCDEVRKVAKEKYGKEYQLKIFANELDGVDYDNIIQETVAKKKKNTYGLYIKFKKGTVQEEFEQVFLFAKTISKNNIIRHITTRYKAQEPVIYVTNDTYEPMCKLCRSIFGIHRKFIFYKANKFDQKIDIEKIMTNTTEIIGMATESVDQAKYFSRKHYVPKDLKAEDLEGMVYVPADTNLSDFDVEKLMNVFVEPDGEEIEIK